MANPTYQPPYIHHIHPDRPERTGFIKLDGGDVLHVNSLEYMRACLPTSSSAKTCLADALFLRVRLVEPSGKYHAGQELVLRANQASDGTTDSWCVYPREWAHVLEEFPDQEFQVTFENMSGPKL